MNFVSKYLGDFHLYENIEGDPVPCNEAAVFISTKGKLYIYRGKDGDWVVGEKIQNQKNQILKNTFPGTTIGNNKKGVHMRSQDPDRMDYIHECPCQVMVNMFFIFVIVYLFQTKSWQKMDVESNKWQADPSIRVLIRQAQVLI